MTASRKPRRFWRARRVKHAVLVLLDDGIDEGPLPVIFNAVTDAANLFGVVLADAFPWSDVAEVAAEAKYASGVEIAEGMDEGLVGWREEFGVVELAGFVAQAEEVGGNEGPVGGGHVEVDGNCGAVCEGGEGGGGCGEEEGAAVHGGLFRELDSIAGESVGRLGAGDVQLLPHIRIAPTGRGDLVGMVTQGFTLGYFRVLPPGEIVH